MKKKMPTAAKTTFWNEIRVKNNLKIRDIAEMLGVSYGSVGGWFSGHKVPRDALIKQLCELFDVDFEVGRKAFYDAKESWVPEHNIKFTEKGNSKKVVTKKAPKAEETEDNIVLYPAVTVADPEVVLAPLLKASKPVSVLEQIYGKVPFDLFLAVQRCGEAPEKVLEQLYGRLDFAEFNKIFTLINK